MRPTVGRTDKKTYGWTHPLIEMRGERFDSRYGISKNKRSRIEFIKREQITWSCALAHIIENKNRLLVGVQ